MYRYDMSSIWAFQPTHLKHVSQPVQSSQVEVITVNAKNTQKL